MGARAICTVRLARQDADISASTALRLASLNDELFASQIN